ncbi:MAG: hypothetical protein WDO71_23875 [Bacteroidota bacterium]
MPEKKYVVEAVITDQPGTAKVLVTQTKSFDEDNNFAGISGATVFLQNPVAALSRLVKLRPEYMKRLV